jgi:hypothetical protein
VTRLHECRERLNEARDGAAEQSVEADEAHPGARAASLRIPSRCSVPQRTFFTNAGFAAYRSVGRTGGRPQLNRVRRTWSLSELVALHRDISEAEILLLRPKDVAVGVGKYVRDVSGGHEYAEVAVELTRAARFTVSLGFEWLPDTPRDTAERVDESLVLGIVEAFARTYRLAGWGCAVVVEFAGWSETTQPRMVQLAASMAVEDAIAKADWTPEPQPDDDAA